MATLVRFPKVGENVEEGQVGRWHKAAGALVEKGEPLVELITDKATFDLESPTSGVLFSVLAPEKSTVPTNYILGIIVEKGDSPNVNERGGQSPFSADGAALVLEAQKENETLMAAYRSRAGAGWSEAGTLGAHAGDTITRIRATPAARRAAKAAGIRLEDIQQAFPGKVIGEEDVRRFLASGKGGSTDANQA